MKVSIPVTSFLRGVILTEKERTIFEIQQYLRNIAKSESDEPAIIPDGIFSVETAEYVRNFQKSKGLNTTGRVDFATFEALRDENERVVFEASLPIQVMAIGNEDLPLSYGDENDFVQKLKMMLNFVADAYDNFPKLKRDSFFDEDTEEAVRRWQSVIFVPETGEVDKITWNSLATYYLI